MVETPGKEGKDGKEGKEEGEEVKDDLTCEGIVY